MSADAILKTTIRLKELQINSDHNLDALYNAFWISSDIRYTDTYLDLSLFYQTFIWLGSVHKWRPILGEEGGSKMTPKTRTSFMHDPLGD